MIFLVDSARMLVLLLLVIVGVVSTSDLRDKSSENNSRVDEPMLKILRPKDSMMVKEIMLHTTEERGYGHQSNLRRNDIATDWNYHYPLRKCEGHCSSDDDCSIPLLCHKPSRPKDKTVPGCKGELDGTGLRFCYDPNDDAKETDDATETEETIQTSERTSSPVASPSTSPSFSFVEAGTLGTSSTPIPTSVPVNEPSISPTTSVPSLSPTSSVPTLSPTSSVPTLSPEMSKTEMTSVVSTLYPSIEIMLVASDSPSDYGSSSREDGFFFVIDSDDNPNNLPELIDVGDNLLPEAVFPLQQCQGDCDGDYECEGDLICFERVGFDKVPGCFGYGLANNDYCIHPDDDPAQPPTNTSFRIKLYWELGFTWQEELHERNWCMECFYNKCDIGDAIELLPCTGKSTYFEFIHHESRRSETEEVQIQIATTDLCLQLMDDDTTIAVQKCDETSRRQKFKPGTSSAASFEYSNNAPFEIIPIRDSDGCVTQHHHPRSLEQIYKATCELARTYDTSYWNKY